MVVVATTPFLFLNRSVPRLDVDQSEPVRECDRLVRPLQQAFGAPACKRLGYIVIES
jgi:hypothetical protein